MARGQAPTRASSRRAPAPAAPEAARDRGLVRVRAAAWVVGLGAAAGTVVLSVVSAHAFKGHTGGTAATAARGAAPPAATRAPRPAPIQVPGPQAVPSIDGAPAPLQPPSSPPSSASSAPAPAPAPEPPPPPPVSGGS